jgi:hypothetical protein
MFFKFKYIYKVIYFNLKHRQNDYQKAIHLITSISSVHASLYYNIIIYSYYYNTFYLLQNNGLNIIKYLQRKQKITSCNIIYKIYCSSLDKIIYTNHKLIVGEIKKIQM